MSAPAGDDPRGDCAPSVCQLAWKAKMTSTAWCTDRMRHIDGVERRARLGVRHSLAARSRGPTSLAGRLVGLHSSDPATVYLAARSRLVDFQVADLEWALYEQRTLVRMPGMRRTMFVVPLDLAGVMNAACMRVFAPRERKRTVAMIESQGIAADGQAWLDRVANKTIAVLAELGEATGSELAARVPELKLKLVFGEGRKWGGTVGLSTRVLFLLAAQARIVRGRPAGTWISSQYRWARMRDWVEGGLDVADPATAKPELIRRWLRAFGPGTMADLKWWTGWNLGDTRRVLSDIDAVEVQLDDGTGFVLADDLEMAPAPDDWVALLPGLDPTVMGWKERGWFLGGHETALFDKNGNAGPTVWHNGRVVGGWGQLADGRIVYELLEKLGSRIERKIEAEAEALGTWLGDMRITPRFRTPVEKRLTV